ncbi:MAG TPA: carbon-nitrogen hydrolase [Bryobacterales bacterium]|nr:carbon-nitrogen hydrolase [Bryobacterales bacterium]
MASSSQKVSVGLVQMACSSDRDGNLSRAVVGIRAAAERGARMICLQELFRSVYFCQEENADWFDAAEPIPGPTTEALAAVARECEAVVIGSIFEKRAPGLYHNSAVVIDADGSMLGVYRKMHIPDDPLYYEKYYFTPGDLGFQAFDTRYGRIGVLICWDQWYPEAARLTALKGAEILFYPTAIGWHPAEKEQYGLTQIESWRTIQRSHAIANGVFVAAPNRVGIEKPLADSPNRPANYQGIEFWGGSFVCDPSGAVLSEASHDREEVLVVECDLSRVDETRRNWPFLRDRRIDAYEGLQARYLGAAR